MHIPKGASQTCALLTFDDALHCTEHDDYDAARWLYVPPYYTEYRYILGTRGANPLICIGINPSTAQPGDLDNTLKSVERIALGNGYDSFTMFNVYPQRATDPNAMDTTFNRALHEQNMAAFRYVLGQYAPGNRPAVWAAWGTLIEKRPYLFDALEEMLAIGEEFHAQWLTFGPRSKAQHSRYRTEPYRRHGHGAGHPANRHLHPLRLRRGRNAKESSQSVPCRHQPLPYLERAQVAAMGRRGERLPASQPKHHSGNRLTTEYRQRRYPERWQHLDRTGPMDTRRNV